MKKAVSIFLSFVIVLQIFNGAYLVINYLVNKDQITRMYCVEKQKKTNNCHGSCHLKKQLGDEEKSSATRQGIPLRERPDEVLFCEQNSGIQYRIFQNFNTLLHFDPEHNALNGYLSLVFVPPKIKAVAGLGLLTCGITPIQPRNSGITHTVNLV